MEAGSGPLRGPFHALDRSIHWLAGHSDQFSAFICLLLIVATTLAMILFQLGVAFAWVDDVLRTLMIWFIYLGSVYLCLRNDHISMDALYLWLPKSARKVVDAIVGLLGVGLSLYIAKIGLDSMMQQIEYGAVLPSGSIPAWPQYLALPLCFGLMAVAYASFLVSTLTGRRSHADGEAERNTDLV